MIVRVRTSQGMHRLQVDASVTAYALQNELAKVLGADKATVADGIQFFLDPGYKQPLLKPKANPQTPLTLRHGDLIFARLPTVASDGVPTTNQQVTPTAGTANAPAAPTTVAKVAEDPVDVYLEQQPGLIPRPRDTRFCNHSPHAMCDYCMPLEPFDPSLLEERNIRHLSFHSYLRKLTASYRTSSGMAGSADLSLGMGVTVSTASRGVSAQELHQGQRVIPPPLEEPNFKVKVPCSAGHPSWPESICTKCQPSAITLQRQNFRLVDHVSFATSGMVDRYIQYWRQTGCQRFAYLYGHYEPYTEKVPLGIQAVVEAIYEPPQQDLVDGLTVDMQWAAEAEVDKLAQLCGLVKVGMIFSDLTDDGSGQGSVMCKRHIGSYFMTSLECHFAAHMQLKHRNPCKWSMSGYFGSKFVTCIVSGNGEGGIDISAYQMSTAAMAMADADIIEPTVDPSKMRVKPATRQRYVPDIMYKYINEYNVPVTQNAKPVFPVEYLLTTVTHGFPENPNPRFITKEPFPIGNRPTLSQISESFLYTHLFIDGVYPSLNHLSDFHLLCHIAQLQVLSLEELQLLAKVATTYDEAAMDLLMHTPGWATLTTLLKQTHQASKPPTTAAPSAPNASSASGTQDTPMEDALSEWSCRHCTFANPAVLSECEMCGLPRDQ